MKNYFLISLFFIGSIFSAYSQKIHTYVNDNSYPVEKIEAPKEGKIKNVILMIGDGMSLMHAYSAWTANQGKLWLENAQYIGLSKTYCANKLITDSGAGGTAIATGQKTNFNYVGVDVDGKPLKSLAKLANEKGLSSGIVVTCHLCDATPADFCCHNTDRDRDMEIAADYVNCGVDYVFGGGSDFFEKRPDGRNLFKELEMKGYQISRDWYSLEKIESGKVFAIHYPNNTPKPSVRKDMLARASMKGIDLLKKNDNGFFLMIEGSQIDDYGHSNELDILMQEIFDFDQTVGEILQWAAEDGETLVVITADHETGGLTLLGGDISKGEIRCNFSTDSHTGVMVPVYSFGPGSEHFSGIYENTDIFKKIKQLLDL